MPGNDCNCKKTETVEASPQQAEKDERLHDTDPHPYQHRGRAVRVPTVLDHHRFLQDRRGHQLHDPRVVAQPVGVDQLPETFRRQERTPVAAGRALQPLFQRGWRANLFLRRPNCSGRAALDDKHRVHGRHVHDPHLHHRRNGRLCAGKKALRRPQAALHPHRLRNGPAQAGHPHPAAA